MPIFRRRPASLEDFPRIVELLPAAELGRTRQAVLQCWQHGHEQGSLAIGVVEDAETNKHAPVIVAVGVTAFITDDAAEQLLNTPDAFCSTALYRSAKGGRGWLLSQQDIAVSHSKNALNLWIPHFWLASTPDHPQFPAIFVQADALFRDLHDGFGVGRFLQEVEAASAPMLEAAGMRILRPTDSRRPRVLLGLSRADARATPGSLMSFLFLAPPAKLGLKHAEQVMLGLALRQLTDDDIAALMDCSREYVRKLWARVYDALHANAALAQGESPQGGDRLRGREKRRRALDFVRSHPEELRPGRPLPDQRAVVIS